MSESNRWPINYTHNDLAASMRHSLPCDSDTYNIRPRAINQLLNRHFASDCFRSVHINRKTQWRPHTYTAIHGRTRSSNRPWLSRQTVLTSCGLTRNSGPLHKYPNRVHSSHLTVPGLLPCSILSFPLLLFVTLYQAPFSPLRHYPVPC